MEYIVGNANGRCTWDNGPDTNRNVCTSRGSGLSRQPSALGAARSRAARHRMGAHQNKKGLNSGSHTLRTAAPAGLVRRSAQW
eukprot:5511213-Prymnesium_polylepis.1